MNALTLGAMIIAVQFLWILIALVALIFLLRLYSNTRMSGFVWLIGAVVVWPLLMRATHMVLPMWLAAGHESLLTAATLTNLLSGAETLIGGALLLTAVILLDRQFAARVGPAAATAPFAPAVADPSRR